MAPLPEQFEPWLNRLEGFSNARVLSITPVDGGASNITCKVDLLGGSAPAVCLRMQRERGIFEPYDVVREGRVIRALAATGVPVPRLIASEPGGTALGAPFIVLEWVDAPHMGIAASPSFSAFTRAVVEIHRVDWQSNGMGFLGVPESPRAGILRELDIIAKRMPAFGCEKHPLLVAALERLRATAPDSGRLALCQGDINIFNYLFLGEEVVAVVDWEQARISDPRSDIGQLVSLSHLKGAPFGPAEAQPFVQAYGVAAGRSVTGMAYFRARWLFELGVIYHGWLRFNDSQPWYEWDHLADLLERSLAELA
ncbi:MAG: phosphotransferase family protein [Dehalococcoidia bacterium]|uniref:phosphotransferase family protein n=1 Tax=Candidatus Amarobacter glycogenicus TaxID=3140699 RepID=UPI001E08A381|nr:phosphotransferase family protein [Dehalococcoidia bacterium]MBK7726728.1 phosphotransferase family protein [Dehalococcoidia bacterium]MBK8560179.1 phosphotransferase family protein [Dehalococcoidia bacterium]